MPDNRVLIIDDDQRICRILKRIAGSLGVECRALDDPEAFASVYCEYQPNVILMDLQMPKMDGVELLRLLAKQSSEAAIILISGMDKSVIETVAELGNSLDLNMSGMLVKPIDIEGAKELLKKNFTFVKNQSVEPTELSEDELKQAIEKGEIQVYYQPQIDIRTGKLIGAEALVRWQHPEKGLIFPDSFIPLAESKAELIAPLTFYVIDTVLKDETIRQKYNLKLNFSINLSARLLYDLDLPDKVEKLLEKYSFDPSRLILEITESGAMDDPSLTMDILTRLRLKNIKLSIDDFGTGFSSMVQLYRMPFTEIKVDKSFVMEAIKEKEAAAIVQLTISLGRNLDLKVVAEGVEDKACYDWLKKLDCDIGQGYHISKAIDIQQFCDWAVEYNESVA